MKNSSGDFGSSNIVSRFGSWRHQDASQDLQVQVNFVDALLLTPY